MNCFMCNKPLIVGKTLKDSDDYNDLIEVNVEIHCATCHRIFSKNKMLQERLIDVKNKMKSHLKEYRFLKREKDFIDKEIVKPLISNDNV